MFLTLMSHLIYGCHYVHFYADDVALIHSDAQPDQTLGFSLPENDNVPSAAALRDLYHQYYYYFPEELVGVTG